MNASIRPTLLCATLVVVGAACSAEAAAPPSASTPPTSQATPPAASIPAAVVPAGPRGVVLTRYEVIRAALADDNAAAAVADLDGLRTAIAALVVDKAAGAADLDKGVAGLAAAATPKDGAAIDLQAVRLAFGELSRGVVAVVAADSTLQPARFLFECPMARGYQRWVQTTPEMKNPYMGKRMLECGSAISVWRVEG